MTTLQPSYRLKPVVHVALADLDTPLSIYLKLAKGPYSYLLESAQGGEKWGRYSIIGLPARTVVRVNLRHVQVITDGDVVEDVETDDPLAFIEAFQNRFEVVEVDGLPRFFGGLVGYFGYDTVRYVEQRLQPAIAGDRLDTPDILLMVSEEVVVMDNLEGRMKMISLVDADDPQAEDEMRKRLRDREETLTLPVQGLQHGSANQPVRESDFISEFGEEEFKAAVETIKEYTRAGDVMQVVLAQRMHIPFQAPPINMYRALRSLNPSPYMYFMDLGDFQIVSSSPEILARVEDGVITRRRGHTEEEDLAFEAELQSDPKELAEHLMLIDLGRNDVGRVSQAGSVNVVERFVIERYSHVMHLSSTVEGKLQPDKSAIDVLRAALPVGTLSGAPKVRAMEIIDELEPVKRGIYGGAVGYLAWNGNMDTAIAIRTAVIKDGYLYIQAGGGIVHDSIDRLEWKESLNKGRAIFRAAAMAENRMINPDN